MAIKFNGLTIPGTHESPITTPPALQTVRTHFAGLLGGSEIRLGRKDRPIYIPIVLHNGWSQSGALINFLEVLDRQVGNHGDLAISKGSYGGVPRLFKYCTFEGFTKDPRPDSGPLPDNVGLLDGGHPSWWVQGVLAFHQLSVEV